MATVGRVEAIWQNFIGAPGYTRFTFEAPASVADATTITGKVRAFFNSVATILPNAITVQVQQQVPIYDEQTGQLIDEIAGSSAPAVVTGTGTVQAYAGGAGAMVGWKTASIWQGRRVQGRSFLVPLIGGVAETNGTLTSAAISTIQTAANGLVSPSTPAFGVWAKKWITNADGSRTQIDGSFFLATQAIIPDRTGILRSRRD